MSIIYLATPIVVWLVGWFEWWVGLPLAALLVAGLWRPLSGSWRISLSSRIVVSFLAALAWLLIVPISGLWEKSTDFIVHLTLLLDMGRGSWPTYLTDFLYDDPSLLGYYLGWHMIPGLIGWWLGPATLSWAVPLWTWIGIGLMITLFTRGLPTLRASLIAIIVLVFFSGMDAVEHLIHQGPSGTFELMLDRLRSHKSPLEWSHHAPNLRLTDSEYFSNSRVMWWSPHHLIPGGLASLIIIGSRHQPRFAAVSGLVLTICMFWSPLVAIGLLPLGATLAFTQGIRAFLRWPNLVVAPPILGLIVLYLLSTDIASHSGWLWQYYTSNRQLLLDIVALYLTEFILLSVLLYILDHRIIREPIFITSIAVLIVAPWYVFGSLTDQLYQHYIITRATMSALIVLTYYISRAVISRLPETVGSSTLFSSPLFSSTKPSRRWPYASMIVVLAVGVISPLFVFLDTTNRPSERPYSLYSQTERMWIAYKDSFSLIERLTTNVPRLLRIVLRESNEKGLEIGEPVIRSKYDIYMQEEAGMLVYTKRNCIHRSEEAVRVFALIYPADMNDLPIYRMRAGYDIREDVNVILDYRGNGCIRVFGLPDYEIDRIVVGQYLSYVGILWATEYRYSDLNPVTHLYPYDPKARQPYSFYYQTAEEEVPIISSVFNVHLAQLHQNTLIYIKEPCTLQDTETPFFLHITPVNPEDLPDHRQQAGFDNHDFRFNDQGIIHDDRCLALIPIPDYSITSISTGQFHPDTNHISWQQQTDINQ